MGYRLVVGLLSLQLSAFGANYLVKLGNVEPEATTRFEKSHGGTLILVSRAGQLFRWETTASTPPSLHRDPSVIFVQRSQEYGLLPNPSLEQHRKEILMLFTRAKAQPAYPDNPEIEEPSLQNAGKDPLLGNSWGISMVGADKAWKSAPQGQGIIVAVIDTGVDYNHPDLINNIWRNSKEIAGNGKDDDGNGYIDDVVGWDFATNDNRPYDLSMSLFDILSGGGNPGHGTHVSGVVASSLNNTRGTAGVAPQARIMALRFISETGQGTTEAAVKAIDYAVDNGANVINASWGGEKDSEPDAALQDAIHRAGQKGVIFVAAAGNGRMSGAGASAGFDNDTDAKPMIPAAYDFDNMIAVAAMDSSSELATFSNWGAKSVKLAAPGVKILSTVPGNRYQDTIIDLGSMQVTWDGTSMATPFVAGALAVLWSNDRSADAIEIRETLLKMTVAVPAFSGKVLTGGRLDLHNIR